MELFKKIIANTVFVIQVLIVFILLFHRSIELPGWLQAVGRLHPLLLHLPIGLLLLSATLIFTRRYFEGPSFTLLISFLLHLTAFTASLTTFMGLLLSLEGGYAEGNLVVHKWMGISLSFMCWLLITLKPAHVVVKPVTVIGVIVLIVTGHFGANLTHGENFVLAPLQNNDIKTRVITDSSTVFAAVIEPILENKCYSCHNEQKAKGKLVLTSLESITKGGKNGPLWHPRNVQGSHIMERLTLPDEHKEHMPPKDKAQLSADEIQFIAQWIEAGANTKTILKQLDDEDTLKKLSAYIIPRYQKPSALSVYQFAFASPEKIQRLSIPSRSVFQIAKNEPALQAVFYLRENFNERSLKELVDVKEQLITLNLTGMPVDDKDLETIGTFANLEKLILNNTNITGGTLNELTKLEKLKAVSICGTKVTAQGLQLLVPSKSLRTVYLWNTGITKEEIGGLKKQSARIHWEPGYFPDPAEKIKLSPPLLKNEEQVLAEGEDVVLKHNLPGAEIRYSITGEVDSVNGPLYKAPIAMQRYSVVKARAFKEGWLGSDTREYILFKKGKAPSSAHLLTSPDPKYPGEGVQTLMNGTKGLRDFYRDPAWMGFRNNAMEAHFVFEKDVPTVSHVTLSYARNVYAMCMPPATMEVWGGNNKNDLRLLGKITPEQPKEYGPVRIEGTTVSVAPSKFSYYKVVAKPLAKLPAFRKAEKEKGWLMVDEIFFN